MIVKDVYQSGLNIMIDGFKALTEGSDEIPNYGAKSNTMFDHCQVSFLVSDVRGVEIITLKNLANTVKVLSAKPFTTPKKLRPTIFSNEYPMVNTTAEYKRFADTTSKVVQKNISLVSGLPDEMQNLPAMYKYNFAGSVAFEVLVTFTGSNITQLIGVFPGQGLKDKDGTWIDPNGQYFVNKAVSAFKKIYYDALEGIFGTVDMQTDVALEKLYFRNLRSRDMAALDPTTGKIPNVLYAQAINPMGSIDLLSSAKATTPDEMQTVKDAITQRMAYADNVAGMPEGVSVFGDKGKFLLDNTTFIIYAQCSIQTLLMLHAYTNIVSYYTDMKNVLGVSGSPSPTMTSVTEGIKIDGNVFEIIPEDRDALVKARNQIAVELVSDIETEKTEILNILREYNKDRDYYEENRYRNTKLRPPKSMIQRKEYYNMVPLYAQTCCVLKFTKKDIAAIDLDNIQTNLEFKGILMAMNNFAHVAENYLSYFK